MRDRPGLEKLLNGAEEGDEVFATKLDRLGRNTLDMITTVEQLHERGVSVTFLDDNLSTKGDIGYILITILSAVARAKRARILERTNEGRQAAGARYSVRQEAARRLCEGPEDD